MSILPPGRQPTDLDPADASASIGPGAFVAVVGPSGAGKDTLLRLAKADLAGEPGVSFPRRLITRGPDANEDHVPVTEAEFAAALKSGDIVLSWHAHGLDYGLPLEVDAVVRAGGVVVANLSRRAIAPAKARYQRLAVVVVTAPAEVLAERLAKRGREDAGAVLGRLARAEEDVPDADDVTVIQNVSTAEGGAAALVAVIRRLKDRTITLP